MKLRGRLVLKVAAMVIPFAVFFGLGVRSFRTSLVVDTIAAGLEARGTRELQRCEEDPAAFVLRRGEGRRRRRFGERRSSRRRFRERLRPRERRTSGQRSSRRRSSMHRFGVFDGETFEGFGVTGTDEPGSEETGGEAPGSQHTSSGAAAFGALGHIAPELRSQLEAGEPTAWVARPGGRLVVAQRIAEAGPCAIMVVERRTQLAGLGASLLGPLVVSVFSLLLVLVAAGPIVRRLRRLEEEVTGNEFSLTDAGASDEIGTLADAFAGVRGNLEQSIEALEERERILSEYIANTTHDVMLPLTVLQGHLVAVGAECAAMAQAGSLQAGIARAIAESHYLASMLQNMNAMARLEGDQVVLTDPVDLNDIVERVVARNLPVAKEKGVEVNHGVPSEPLLVFGDSTLLQRALGNVVVNAVRYNEPGGHVAVVLEEEGGSFELRILDDGPGVDDAELRRLGERRHRGAARTRHPSGSGLGLSIAREVAERHGFALRFEHGPGGQGLMVVFSGKGADIVPG